MLRSVPDLIAEADVERVSIDDALAIDGVVIIDVREPQEAAQRPAAGIINIPRGVLEMQITGVTQDSEAPICVHCASGARAILAAEQLLRLGYTNVRAINSSIDEICLQVGSDSDD